MKVLTLLLLLFAFATYAQPGSEIILFDLKAKKKRVTLTKPRNITNHPGYDNQPSFHTDEPVIYYASFNEEGRSDIKAYNVKTQTTTTITRTPEREYSPTLTPDKTGISCIIQRDNGAQDLGKYPLDGTEPYVIIDSLIVGYHVWADNSHLALFVLGKNNTPNTLHYVRLPTKADTVIAENIGRSLHRIPKERAISFVHKAGEGNWQIKKLHLETMQVSFITNTLPNHEDIAWLPDGRIISSDGTKLFVINPRIEKTWSEVSVTDAGLLKGITRLAVNASGDKLAVVVSE
ncbi:MAG: PD40 domain-containing protein [Cytophagales bacterium]|nr:PD40 domain-containing protein [Cytophagales bacterium]